MIAAEVTYWGVVLKMAILGLSLFATGVMLYRALVIERKRHRPYLALALLGVSGLITEVGVLVILPQPVLEPRPETWAFLAFLVAVFVGFLGDAIRNRRRWDVEDHVFQQLDYYEDQWKKQREEDKDA